MDPEIQRFIKNVDNWIKVIRREFSTFSDIPAIVDESVDNIQHNYELIYELIDKVDELSQEVNVLKLIHIMRITKSKKKKEDNSA